MKPTTSIPIWILLLALVFSHSVYSGVISGDGSIGGDTTIVTPILEEGTYMALHVFYEEYDPNTFGADSSTTYSYPTLEVSLNALVDLTEGDGDHEYTQRAVLLNAPEGMSAEYTDVLTITWQSPYVAESTSFEFDYGVELLIDGEIAETLTHSHTIFVSPALPFISDENVSSGSFRPNDPTNFTPSFYIQDRNETIDGNELGIINPDPRLIVTQGDGGFFSSSNHWNITWNEHFQAPLLTEIIPLKLSLKDFDGVGTRRTTHTLSASVFGYSYEAERIPAPTPVENEHFGSAVTIQGNTTFVATDGSAIHIYTKDLNEDWILAQTLTSPNTNQYFGSSIASEAHFLAIGAVALNQSTTGAVYIYRYDSGTDLWNLTQTLTPDDSTQEGKFGGDVALTQPDPSFVYYTLMVAADGAASNGAHTGAVWVYEDTSLSLEGSNFTKQQIIVPDDAEAYDYFGWPLALKGDVAVLPANEDDDQAQDSGAVYIYRRNQDTGTWTQQQKLVASDATTLDLFGERVAISDQGIFISAFRKDKLSDELIVIGSFEPTPYGAVYHFKEIDGVWQEQGRIRTIEEELTTTIWISELGSLILTDPIQVTSTTVRRFGSSIAADGTTLLVAGRRIGQGESDFERSVVYQFEWNEIEQDWEEVRVLCGSDTDTDDTGTLGKVFGEAQMLAIDGDQIIVGDLGSETDDVSDSGVAYIFNTSFTHPEQPAHYDTFQDELTIHAPTSDAPEDDADGDRISNLQEFFAGSDPFASNPQSIWPKVNQGSDNLGPELLYYFRQSQQSGMLTPTFYVSNTLAADSWREITRPIFGADTMEGNQLIRHIDLSEETTAGEPLFLKMSLNSADVAE